MYTVKEDAHHNEHMTLFYPMMVLVAMFMPLFIHKKGKNKAMVEFLLSGIFIKRVVSRAVGKLMQTRVPHCCRWKMYSVIGTLFKTRFEDFDERTTFPSLQDVFVRKLKVKRELAANDVTSPVDGKVLSFGELEPNNDELHCIKNCTFSLDQFLHGVGCKQEDKIMDIKERKNKLFYCVFYLSPGDYHRFHSCSDGIKINKARHIVGDLYPVAPYWLKRIPQLFAVNERVVMSGTWNKDQFFSYTAVGALNVGSIHINGLECIQTNQPEHDRFVDNKGKYKVCGSVETLKPGKELTYGKGDEVGYFSFGSTVVLVFEANDFKFKVRPGQKVLMGQSIGDLC